MFESVAITQTTVSVPQFGQIYFDKPRTPLPTSLVATKSTEASSTKARGIELRTVGEIDNSTSTVAELTKRSPEATTEVLKKSDVHSRLEKARNDRVTLLAQKYEGKLNPEGNARLEILTHRLDRLSPRVTQSNLNALSHLISDMESVSSGLESLRKKFSF